MSLQQFECNMWILHILIDGILPKWVANIIVKANFLFSCTWDFNPKFNSALSNTLIFQASNQTITLLWVCLTHHLNSGSPAMPLEIEYSSNSIMLLAFTLAMGNQLVDRYFQWIWTSHPSVIKKYLYWPEAAIKVPFSLATVIEGSFWISTTSLTRTVYQPSETTWLNRFSAKTFTSNSYICTSINSNS